MKKIGIVARGINKGGGVERYLKNILFDMNRQMGNLSGKLIIFADKEYDFLEKLDMCQKVIIKKQNKLLWDNLFLFLELRRYKLDCVIYPKNIIPLTNFLLNFKKINIIHDLGYFKKELDAYGFFDTLFMRTFMGMSCRKSDWVIAISEFTKQDIVNRFGIDEKKIVVSFEAVENNFQVIENQELLNEIKKKYNLTQPFLFYSGSISPRKNILRVLKAFNKLKNKIPHNFYFTGSRGWNNKNVWKYIQDNKLENRIKKIGYVEDNELPALYNLADLCLYPSLYEGFGLPILEAQACGCPVLTSNVSSLPEVAGEGVCIIDPYSVEEIERGIRKIIDDDKYRTGLIERGHANTKRFGWDKAAEAIIKKLYE